MPDADASPFRSRVTVITFRHYYYFDSFVAGGALVHKM